MSTIAATAAPRGAITRTAAFALAALVAASALGYFGLGAYRKAHLQRTVTALARDTSARLETALALETATPIASSPQTVSTLDEHAQEVDKHAIELRDMSASPNRPLVAAAEDYLLTVRQILREQAASHRYRVQVAASGQKLRDHMRSARRRSAGWIDEAVRAKDRVERNYFDYRVSSEALERLLASYPASRKRLAALIGAPLLGDAPVDAGRKRVLATSKRIAADVNEARQLAAVR